MVLHLIQRLLHRDRSDEEHAAVILQRHYRAKLAIRQARVEREIKRLVFDALVLHLKLIQKETWRHDDITAYSREELNTIGHRLGLPIRGKKQQLQHRLRDWIDSSASKQDVAIQTAALAMDKHLQCQGSVYYWENSNVVNLRPLRGKGIDMIACGYDTQGVYAINSSEGSVWLCRSSGLSAQRGLCSTLTNLDDFDSPSAPPSWFVAPVLMKTLLTDHITQMDFARSHGVAVSKAGEVYVWGDSPHGECGLDAKQTGQERVRGAIVPGLEEYKVVQVAVGTQHTAAVCEVQSEENEKSSTVVCVWGNNAHGQCGIRPVEETLRKGHSSKDNALASTLRRSMKSSKTFPETYLPMPTQVPDLKGITRIACGALHSTAISDTGLVYSWGSKDGGRQGRDTGGSTWSPALVSGCDFAKIQALDVACGAWHSAILVLDRCYITKTTYVMTWGTGTSGQLGQGNCQQSHIPHRVMLTPVSNAQKKDFKSQKDNNLNVTNVACGMFHTAVLTAGNDVYRWGSQDQFSPLPLKMDPAKRSYGRITSISCGKTFTMCCVQPLDEESYDGPGRLAICPPRPIRIPTLAFDQIRKPELIFGAPKERLMPHVYRQAKEAEVSEKLKQVDFQLIVSPLCRICWKCSGFDPSPKYLWMCSNCGHNRRFHGVRRDPLSEYEAVRKLQSRYRVQRARRLLCDLVASRTERVYHIETDSYFYYNTWNAKSSWQRPKLLLPDVDPPIRDPDDIPEAVPPMTLNEAAAIIQQLYRRRTSQKFLRFLLEKVITRKWDPKTGKYFYLNNASKTSTWIKPRFLAPEDDIGQLGIPPDVAAEVIQRCVRRYQGLQKLRALLHAQLEKHVDPKTGQEFYVNTQNGTSSWTKPPLLASSEDIGGQTRAEELAALREKRRLERASRPKPISDVHHAARRIQHCFRRRQAMKWMRRASKIRYDAILDKKSGKYYYVDKTLGTVTWKKPLYYPPPKRRRKKHKKPKKRRPRPRVWNPETAAVALQELSKRRAARIQLYTHSRARYTAHVDPTSGKTYVANVRTGVVSWSPPPFYFASEAYFEKERRKRNTLPRKRVYVVTDRNEAAEMIQAYFRQRVFRRALLRRLAEHVERVYDPHSRRYFYYHKRTQVTSWDKPKLLKTEDLNPENPRLSISKVALSAIVKTPVTDPTEAAVAIQGLFRLRQAKRRAKISAQSRFEKVYDETQDVWYYFDRISGASQWTKPSVLNEAEDVHRVVNPLGERLVRMYHWTPERAALVIQSQGRKFLAKRKCQRLLREHVRSHFDPVQKRVFYHNTLTKTSSWIKPKLLQSVDVDQEEEEEEEEGANDPVQEQELPRKQWTEKSAALAIQSQWRRIRALQQSRFRIHDVYQKHFDEEEQLAYYYNTSTQQSTWTKPKLLGSQDLS